MEFTKNVQIKKKFYILMKIFGCIYPLFDWLQLALFYLNLFQAFFVNEYTITIIITIIINAKRFLEMNFFGISIASEYKCTFLKKNCTAYIHSDALESWKRFTRPMQYCQGNSSKVVFVAEVTKISFSNLKTYLAMDQFLQTTIW